MKTAIAKWLSASLVGVVATAFSPTQAQSVVTLKAISYMPKNKFEDSMAVFESWAQKVEAKTGDKLRIKLIGGPEVFPVNDQVSAASKGLVDIVLAFNTHAALVPEVNTVGLSSITVHEERENGYLALLDKAHEKINLKVIGRASTNSGFHVFSRKPIRQLADFKGLKIRSHVGYKSVFEAVGAHPISIGISEIYSALERNMVDAAPYNLFVHDMGINEVTKYVLEDAFWTAHTTTILMNKKRFDTLPEAYRQALIEAQIENEAGMADQVARLKDEERAKLTEAGMEFTSLPPEEAQQWRRISVDTRFKDLEERIPAEQLARIKTLILRH